MRIRLTLLTLLIAVGLTAAANGQAQRTPRTTPLGGYTLAGSTTLDDLNVDFRAYAILPTKLTDRTANGGAVLRFGPIGSCHFNLSIAARVRTRPPGTTAADRAAGLVPGTGPYVYAQGTRGSSAWRVVRLRGSAHLRGIWLAPVGLRTTNSFQSPTVPAWLEVRGTADDHTAECHSGGPRYIGSVLATAFGAMTGTAFSTDLPRLTAPPPAA